MSNFIKNKWGLKLVTSRFSGYETSPEKFFYSLYMIWPSLRMQCEAVFELLQKLDLQIYASQFMTSWVIPLQFVLLNLCGKNENEKSFLDKIKSIFYSF